MVEETIQVIQDTEAKADDILKEARESCDRIVEDATKKASELKLQEIQKAKEAAASAMNQVVLEGEKASEYFQEDIKNEVQSLKMAAAEKEAAAVKLVISQLV